MSNHADFYVGAGEQALWLGSLWCRGQVSYIAVRLAAALPFSPERLLINEAQWRQAVDTVLHSTGCGGCPAIAGRADPWPYGSTHTDSSRTDFVYTWTPDSPILVSVANAPWLTLDEAVLGTTPGRGPAPTFPDMSSQMVRVDG